MNGFFSWLKSELTAFLFRLFYLATVEASFPQASGSEQTIFILGSGSSVDDLTAKQWDFISQNMSIGINFWTTHTFTPNFYALEKSRLTQLQALEILNNSASPVKGTRVLWFGGPNRINRRLLGEFKRQGGKVWFYTAFPMSRSETKKGHDTFALLARLIQFIPAPLRPAIDGGNTVTRLVTLAALNGWKSIVLLGVDLGGPYFKRHREFSEELSSYAAQVNDSTGSLEETHLVDSAKLGNLRLSATLTRLNSSLQQLGMGKILAGNVDVGRRLGVDTFDWG